MQVERDPAGKLCATARPPSFECAPTLLLPLLYQPQIRRMTSTVLSLQGFESVGPGWYLQEWSCRWGGHFEWQVAERTPSACLSELDALYTRWWSDVCADAAQRGSPGWLDVARMADVLEIPLGQVWPFVDWVTTTKRGYVTFASQNGMGAVCTNSEIGSDSTRRMIPPA